jgi:hypothetical protein
MIDHEWSWSFIIHLPGQNPRNWKYHRGQFRHSLQASCPAQHSCFSSHPTCSWVATRTKHPGDWNKIAPLSRSEIGGQNYRLWWTKLEFVRLQSKYMQILTWQILADWVFRSACKVQNSWNMQKTWLYFVGMFVVEFPTMCICLHERFCSFFMYNDSA